MSTSPTLVWFRSDLRVNDNHALVAAFDRNRPVVPVFLWEPAPPGNWTPGSASRWWLHHSLKSLHRDLHELGSRLIIRLGNTDEEIDRLIDETGADALYWNRHYEPSTVRRDALLAARLRKQRIEAESFKGNLLFEPNEIETKQGSPYQVFTPFWKACLSRPEPASPIRAPKKLIPPQPWPRTEPIESLDLEPKHDWTAGLRETWTPGASGARKRLQRFLKNRIEAYQTERDRPDVIGTSRLSPHLHFGELSVRQIWHAVKSGCSTDRRTSAGKSTERFLSELGWREFARHVLFHFPQTTDQPLRQPFGNFPWIRDPQALRAWQMGQTGYPIVDAGMREMWQTGWMHNRVRMIVGSFLTKDLLISWREGAKWFWKTLVDADLANNTLGWQWISGCGADAAPYFRIFNPVSQGRKFDPQGAYVRRWIPELGKLPDRWIHEPWAAPSQVLIDAGIKLGQNYPARIVDHAEARRAALAAFDGMPARQ